MKQPVTIDYASPGLKPPVFLFTSLSDPQWEAVEMDSGKNDNGEFWFHKTFTAEEGEYQYKFRLGPGDWWSCDDSKPVVDDGAGNKNNLLIVKPVNSISPTDDQPPAAHQTSQDPGPQQSAVNEPRKDSIQDPSVLSAPVKSQDAHLAPNATAAKASTAPQAPIPASQQASVLEQPKLGGTAPPVDRPATIQLSSPADLKSAATPVPTPLLPHETSVAPPDTTTLINASAAGPLMGHEIFASPSKAVARAKDAVDEDDDELDPPLLQHETLNPDSSEQTNAPLIRHETSGFDDYRDEHDDHHRLSPTMHSWLDPFRSSSAKDPLAMEADPNDPTLERFPTDQNGIFEHIRRASTQIPEDETIGSPLRSSASAASENSMSPLASLPSVKEDEEEDVMETERSRQIATEQAPMEAETEKEDTPTPAVIVTEPSEQYPAAPITPPMTPKEAEEIVKEMTIEAEAEAIVEAVIKEDFKTLGGEQQAGTEQTHEDDTKSQKKVIAEGVQERGLFGALAGIVTHPLSWLAVAGIAIAVVTSVYKLR